MYDFSPVRWSAICVALGALAQPPVASAQSLDLGGLAFWPLPPCRIYDTRPGTGVPGQGTGPIPAGAVRSIAVKGAGGCGVPTQAKAAVLNFIAVGPAGAGNLRAWPWDVTDPPPPNASVINYSNVSGLNIANGVVQPICDAQTTTSFCTFDLFLRPDVSATHVVIDVLGYFTVPGVGPVWGDGRSGVQVHGACTNGIFRFGLSNIAVEWSGASAACPAAFWVCTASQRGAAACNTARIDTSCDGRECDGACVDFPSDNHEGWIEGEPDGGTNADFVGEMGFDNAEEVCVAKPVWCCTLD